MPGSDIDKIQSDCCAQYIDVMLIDTAIRITGDTMNQNLAGRYLDEHESSKYIEFAQRPHSCVTLMKLLLQ